MGVSFKRIINLDEDALSRLSKWGALSAKELHELLSWTGESVGNIRLRLRGENFVSRGLRNPIVRGCPLCLKEDVKSHDGDPAEAMVMRGDWQFREVGLCLHHSHPLVELWVADYPSERYDMGARLNEILPALMAGKLDKQLQAPTAFDRWLDDRLEDARDYTWLAHHDLYAAASFCRILGTELLRLDPQAAANGCGLDMQARARGFEVASKGEPSILAALTTLMQSATGRNQEIKAALGHLFYKNISTASLHL